MVIIPEGTACGWAGLGYVGCDGSFMCASWVASRYFLGSYAGAPASTQVALHEQGHNLYLHHAASYDGSGGTVEYGEGPESALLGGRGRHSCPGRAVHRASAATPSCRNAPPRPPLTPPCRGLVLRHGILVS
jgi:hypothetical protein